MVGVQYILHSPPQKSAAQQAVPRQGNTKKKICCGRQHHPPAPRPTRLFGLSRLSLSRLIFSHRILFILPVLYYSCGQSSYCKCRLTCPMSLWSLAICLHLHALNCCDVLAPVSAERTIQQLLSRTRSIEHVVIFLLNCVTRP